MDAQLRGEHQDASGHEGPVRHAACDPEQPGPHEPHRWRVPAVRAGQGRDDRRLRTVAECSGHPVHEREVRDRADATGNGAVPQTYGVTDYVMGFKKPGNLAAVQAFYKLYYSPDEINTWIKAEGFLPVTESGLKAFASDTKDKVYLDTLSNIHLTPTHDPEWDKLKLTIQQNIGLAVAPNGDPKKFLDDLQTQALAGK